MSDPVSDPASEGIRLQKVLSRAGIASRRAAEELIDAGRVSVDGAVVTEQGRRVDPTTAVIHVDGQRVALREDQVYLALNKPRGVHSTMSDERGRRCVGDYVRGRQEGGAGLFHVGRLDADTEGLLLLTNDGELANRLMHPSHEVPKTYLAEVDGTPARDLGRRLRAGIELDDGLAVADGFKVVEKLGGRCLVEIVLHEGRKHVVRRMLAEAGYPVRRLVRTQLGELRLGGAKPGNLRPLNQAEIGALYAAVGL